MVKLFFDKIEPARNFVEFSTLQWVHLLRLQKQTVLLSQEKKRSQVWAFEKNWKRKLNWLKCGRGETHFVLYLPALGFNETEAKNNCFLRLLTIFATTVKRPHWKNSFQVYFKETLGLTESLYFHSGRWYPSPSSLLCSWYAQ